MNVPLTPLRFLHRAMDLYPRKTGVICGEKRFTYREFGERAERLATALLDFGIREGDRVAFLSFNSHHLLEGYFGVVQARAIVMPLNVRLTAHELTAILNHAEARILFFETDFRDTVERLRAACPSIERFIVLNETHALADATYEEFIGRGAPGRADIMSYDENSIAELFYTSGSTGTPKGVMLSHRTLYLHAFPVIPCFSLDDTSVDLHTIPLFHANGWARPQSTTMMGATHVMIRRFDPVQVFRLVQQERVTNMALVPTMANSLINAPERSQYDLSSLRVIHIGGAASSPELVKRVEESLGCRCLSGYGLTETSPVLTSSRPKSTVTPKNEEERYLRQSMAGWPIPGCEVRVADLEMRDVPRDMETIGEVVARGDNIMSGYFKEPDATRAVMSGEWFHTGDMAVWDEDGFIQIVDRKKDIIISGGENISSIEVEKAIFAHPAVFECAVVSAPEPKWGEIPVAIVVLKEGAKLSSDELLAFLEGRLARFKLPRHIEFSSEPLPKTGTGKIVKRALREAYWGDRSRRVQG